jgi:hypothetical protein
VDGDLAYGCTNRSKSSPLFQAARAFRTKLFAAKLFVALGAVGDEKIDSRQTGCATPRRSARIVRKADSRSEEKLSQATPRGTGCAIPTRESGRRAAHPPSNEGALDREKLRRLTTARWNRSRRISPNRLTVHRETHALVSREGRDRGVRGRSPRAWVGPTSPHSAKAVR